MEFFNLGWPEVLLILILAFVILGPDKITQTGRDLGVWLRKLNKSETFRDVMRTTEQIRKFPQKIMDEARLDPVLSERSIYPEVQKNFGERTDAPEKPHENSGDLP